MKAIKITWYQLMLFSLDNKVLDLIKVFITE